MRKIIILFLCAALGIILILDSAGMRDATVFSVTLCLETIIPSLFAFLALSSFVMSSGIIRGEAALFILSMVGGYPVGAKLLYDKVKSEPSYSKRAGNMMAYCFCGSPAYLIAITNSGMYIWLSNVLACLILAVFLNIKNKSPKELVTNSPPLNFSGYMLVNSVTSAGSALYKICAMIVIFGVGIRVLEFTRIMDLLPGYSRAFLEITRVMDLRASPAVIAALTSTGGLCVMFQVAALAGGKIKLKQFFLARIPAAALSGAICHIITRNIAVETTLTQPNMTVSAAGNPLASVCLLIMTLILESSLSQNSHNPEQNT